MMSARRVAGATLLLLVLAGPAPAQDDNDPGAILEQLDSANPREAAWGAYMAGKSGIREAIPLLVERLTPVPGIENEAQRHLRLAVLDALILLDAKVPGDLDREALRRHANHDSLAPAVILLSRNPLENQAALLELYQPTDDHLLSNLTVAVGNLLAGVRADGFVARLLAQFPIRLRIAAVDPGSPTDRSNGDRGLGGGFERIDLPEGFPPHARYRFWSEEVPGARLLADGPRPIWTTREEVVLSGEGAPADRPQHRRARCTLDWLADLLGEDPDGLSLAGRPHRFIPFEDREDYVKAVREARAEAVRPWFELLDRCLRAKLLPPREARRIEPDVLVIVEDRRADRRRPLPTVRFPGRVLSEPVPPGWVFGSRLGHRNLRAMGGGNDTDAAVNMGLDWLDRHQDGTGCWDSDRFSGRFTPGVCPDGGKADLDLVNTALALLAFLGAAETDRQGDHQRAVGAGLDWLIDHQGEDGRFGTGSPRLGLYDHVLATFAMSEAHAYTGDPVLRESLVRAVSYLRTVRRPGGGWGSPENPGKDDPAVTAWVFLALHTAFAFDAGVSAGEIDSLRETFDLYEQQEFAREGPLFPKTKPSLLAMLVVCRERRKHDWPYSMRRDPAVAAAANGLALPTTIGEWTCGTPFMYQVGGNRWRDWNQQMRKFLLPLQAKEGCEKGSWNPADFKDRDLGRIGVTACLITCLEGYYRYGKCF